MPRGTSIPEGDPPFGRRWIKKLIFGNYIFKSRSYGLTPTISRICSALVIASVVTAVGIPSFERADARALAGGPKSFSCEASYATVTPSRGMRAIALPSRYMAIPPGPPHDFLSQCAEYNAPRIWPSNRLGSAFSSTATSNGIFENCDNTATMRTRLSFVSFRGARRVSSAIILACCTPLIPSSKTNKQTVHIDSMTTPLTTSHIAVRWTRGEYCGLSRSIPAPTAIEAITLADMKTACGQNGSTIPESNALTYICILAVLGWAFAAVAAISRLIGSLRALWREKYGKARRD